MQSFRKLKARLTRSAQSSNVSSAETPETLKTTTPDTFNENAMPSVAEGTEGTSETVPL